MPLRLVVLLGWILGASPSCLFFFFGCCFLFRLLLLFPPLFFPLPPPDFPFLVFWLKNKRLTSSGTGDRKRRAPKRSCVFKWRNGRGRQLQKRRKVGDGQDADTNENKYRLWRQHDDEERAARAVEWGGRRESGKNQNNASVKGPG
ncbi:hypothetical protein F4777DRAFT_570454 [Nemania sp. FL0916]|nr:hypothetical protein F4777DRAFT_570454 [Nemania sp. FL0916]